MANDDEDDRQGYENSDERGEERDWRRHARWHAEADHPRARLSVVSMGLAIGVTAAISVFILGVVAALFGWGIMLAQALSSVMVGYGPGFVGAITGAVWAFVIGFVDGVVIAWFYNRFLPRRRD